MRDLDTALLNILGGAGVAGVFCILFVTGHIYPRSVVTDKDRQISELQQTVRYERDRADTAVAGLSATNNILGAIQFGRDIAREQKT